MWPRTVFEAAHFSVSRRGGPGGPGKHTHCVYARIKCWKKALGLSFAEGQSLALVAQLHPTQTYQIGKDDDKAEAVLLLDRMTAHGLRVREPSGADQQRTRESLAQAFGDETPDRQRNGPR